MRRALVFGLLAVACTEARVAPAPLVPAPVPAIPSVPVPPIAPPPPTTLPPTTPGSCVGASAPMFVDGGAPYAEVRIGAASGRFLVDFGTTGSTIDPSAMAPAPPVPRPGGRSPMLYDGGYFLRPLPFLALTPQSHAGAARTFAQAGILGIDQLSSGLFLLDWAEGRISRADTPCDDTELRSLGLVPVPATPPPGRAFVPTIPIAIGGVSIPAQVDTGFADRVVPRSINVNQAAYDALVAAGVRMTPRPDRDLTLSTCAGVPESVRAFEPASAVRFVDADGRAIREVDGVTLFVKSAPEAARRCGGVRTWDTPGPQLGVSLFVEMGRAAFDVSSGVVWIPVSPP